MTATPPTLTRDHLVEQLARCWSRMTSWPGGLRFCEPEAAEAANIYACPMPQAQFRLLPCASLVIEPTADSDPSDPRERVVVRVTVAALDTNTAMLMAGDFAKVYWPCNRPADITEPGQTTPGVLGVPEGAEPGDRVWRFVDVIRLTTPQPVSGAGFGRRAADGHALVQWQLDCYAIEHEIPETE